MMAKFLHNRKRLLACAFLAMIFVTRCSTTVSAQCSAPTLKFHSPVLIDGTSGAVGAVYLFAEVIPGVDAHIEIAGIYGGATLYNIDDSAGIGYYDAFQPYVGAAPNDTSYLDWKITFKVAGTATDTTLACLAVTGVDVDGDGARLQEFIEAATPGSIAVDPNTILNVSFDGVRSKAISTIFNIPLIDSARHEAMFQMNFVNISTLLYRNGAVSTWGAEQIRQTCIYFKPFFETSTFVLLPARILSFTAKQKDAATSIQWSATNEKDLVRYTVQKSTDGTHWKDIQSVTPGRFASTNRYELIDADKISGETYYRLKQLNIRGLTEFSKTIHLNAANFKNAAVVHNAVFTNNIKLQIQSDVNDDYVVNYFNAVGASVRHERFTVIAGSNNHSSDFSSALTPGVYLLVINNKKGERIHSARIIRN